MNKDSKHPRIISRRDSLKVCIVPATALLTGRFLSGCSAAESGESMLTDTGAAADSSSTTTKPAASSGSAGSGVKSTSSTGITSGAAGSSSAANSSSGAAGSSTAPSSAAAGKSGALAQAGSPATGGTPAGGAAGATSATGAAVSAGSAGSASSAGSAGSQAGASGAAGGAATGVTGVAGPGVMWATGGTAKLAMSYPDPFEKSPGTSCKLYPSQTLGPCYSEKPMMRSDISDGLDGLPVRLSFLVVGKDGCTPVPNATVDIWHSGSQGIYSAYAMGTTCNPGSDNVLSKTFCRGVQAVDETGRVNFATVFPGWYRGRTLHIHFTIRVGGKESVTSQLYFEDALVDEILAQGIYKARGMRDTTNTRDMIFSSGNASPDEVIMEHAKRPDGILHGWKVLSIG